MEPLDPADEREWEIHRAFEEKEKRIETLTRWNDNAARLRDEAEAGQKNLRIQLAQAEKLLQNLADALKEVGGYDCLLNDLHYEVVSFLSRRGRIYP